MNKTEMIMYKKLFSTTKPMIGMIHLPPLPGYPAHPGMDAVVKKALVDLKTLVEAGFDGVLVENDNDQPHQIGVSDEIKIAFTQVIEELVKNASIPVGMEIIYDMKATLEVAYTSQADFVRFDVFIDTVETKWGLIQAQAEELVALKKKLHVKDLLIFTDIHVKHAKMLEHKLISQSAIDAIGAGADGLIVTGNWTGQAPTKQDCLAIKKVADDIPVLIGSGLDIQNVTELLSIVDGAIVGTSIKTGEYMDLQKAKKLIEEVKKVRQL